MAAAIEEKPLLENAEVRRKKEVSPFLTLLFRNNVRPLNKMNRIIEAYHFSLHWPENFTDFRKALFGSPPPRPNNISFNSVLTLYFLIHTGFNKTQIFSAQYPSGRARPRCVRLEDWSANLSRFYWRCTVGSHVRHIINIFNEHFSNSNSVFIVIFVMGPFWPQAIRLVFNVRDFGI